MVLGFGLLCHKIKNKVVFGLILAILVVMGINIGFCKEVAESDKNYTPDLSKMESYDFKHSFEQSDEELRGDYNKPFQFSPYTDEERATLDALIHGESIKEKEIIESSLENKENESKELKETIKQQELKEETNKNIKKEQNISKVLWIIVFSLIGVIFIAVILIFIKYKKDTIEGEDD